jgi:flagellar protein FlaF
MVQRLAGKRASQLAVKRNFSIMHYASKAYAKTARETAGPRELEASLLLKAAAKLQAVYDDWREKPHGLTDAVTRDDNKLPLPVRQNIANLGMFVIGETFSLMTRPRPDHLASLIKINRSVAAGLRDKV